MEIIVDLKMAIIPIMMRCMRKNPIEEVVLGRKPYTVKMTMINSSYFIQPNDSKVLNASCWERWILFPRCYH